MVWETPVNLSGSKFPIFKPERPHIDIPSAVAHRTGGAGSSADNDSLRTPIDLPTSHPDTPWYGSQYPYGPYNPLSLTDGLTLVPPGASYDVQQSLPEYDDFSRSMDIDLVPPSPPRRMRELDGQFDERALELSPPSPSRRAFAGLPELAPGRFNEDYSCVSPSYEHYDLSPPSLSPPSPSRRVVALLPEDEWLPDCPELSPPSPRHATLGLPPMNDDFHPYPHTLSSEQPPKHLHFPIDTPPSTSPALLPLTFVSPLSARLHKEHTDLLTLRERTIQDEHSSRARNIHLRSVERSLARVVAALREAETHGTGPTEPSSASSSSQPADSPANNTLVLNAMSSVPPFLPGSLSIPQPSLTTNVKEIIRQYHQTATNVMLERIERKRKRKKDKERLKELRVILGVGVDALLKLIADDILSAQKERPTSQHPKTLKHEPGGDGVGLGLGLVLEQPKPELMLSEELQDILAQLDERTFAMQCLVAHISMRRRDMGMRSLLEAGNMSEAATAMNQAKGSNVGLEGENTMDVDSASKPPTSYLGAKRCPKNSSPLRKEVILEDDSTHATINFTGTGDAMEFESDSKHDAEECSGLLLGF